VTLPFQVGTTTSQLYVWGCGIATAGTTAILDTPTDYNFGGGATPGRDIAGIWGEIDHGTGNPIQCPNDPPTYVPTSTPFTGFANGALPGVIDAFIPPLLGTIGTYQTGVALNNYPLVLEAAVCATPTVDGSRTPAAGEWADDGCHDTANVTVKLGGQSTAQGTVRWFVDATHAYFSVEVPVGGKTPNKANIAFDFDAGDGINGIGTADVNDDQIVMSNTDLDLPDFLANTVTVDGYLEQNCADRTAETPCNTVDPVADDDAVGAIGWDSSTGTLFYEVSKPLLGSDLIEDFQLSAGDTAGFGFQLGVGNVRNKGNTFPATGYFGFFPFQP
jgi:hypothetical protein